MVLKGLQRSQSYARRVSVVFGLVIPMRALLRIFCQMTNRFH
jgi:hypothetical protein